MKTKGIAWLGVAGLLACSSVPHTTIRAGENQGMIRLMVEPDSAHVYVDGQDKGKVDNYEDEDTPLILPAGLHKLQIKEDGYKPFRREVYLGRGSVHELRVTLKAVAKADQPKDKPRFFKPAPPKDTNPPVIEITRPQLIRGIEVTAKDYRTTIDGIARDESKIAWVTINGKQANLDAQGKFWLRVNLGVGENNFKIAAMDTQNNIGYKEIVISRKRADIPLPPQSTLAILGEYHALVIGNNNYKHLRKLRTAQKDAQEIERILKQRYGFKTKLLLDATRNDILHTLNDYRKNLKEDDNFLIYYAGHGIFNETAQKAYWLPIDALRDDNTNWLIVDNITSNIKLISSKHILIVADSCYSGTFTRKAITDISSSQERKRYLQKMLKKSSRTLLASGGNEPVSDIGGRGHSVFAEAFIQGLKDMEQKVFTAESLYYEHIKERVAGSAEQTPEYNIIRNSGHEGGDFIFRKR